MIVVVLVFIACQSPAKLVQLVWGYAYSDCRQVYTCNGVLVTLFLVGVPEALSEICT